MTRDACRYEIAMISRNTISSWRLAAVAALSCGAATGELREFKDLDGRQVTAEIVTAGETSIEVKLKNGKKFKIEIARLSEADQEYIESWVAADAEARKLAAAGEEKKRRAVEIPVKLTEYCKSQMGKQVGNGECWTLADEAFKACGLQRPGEDMRVWGRLVDFKKEKLQAGDIVEYRSAKFSDGSFTGPEHTSVVVKGGRRGIVIAEQNWGGGNKTVHEAPFDPDSLTGGKIMIYRPE